MTRICNRIMCMLLATFLGFVFTTQSGCPAPKQKIKFGPLPPAPAPPANKTTPGDFWIEAMPDTDLAIRNVYASQDFDPVQVLKGWKVKYTAPNGVDPDIVEWFIDGVSIGKKSPFERKENTVGDFTVKMTAPGKEFTRNLLVAEVQSDDFKLTAGGEYAKDLKYVNWVKRPTTAALTMSGKVSLKTGSPKLGNFEWGYIQGSGGLTQNIEFTLAPQKINKNALSKATFVKHPSKLYYDNTPANTNDAPLGRYLYGPWPRDGGWASKAIGSDYGGNPPFDTPGVPFGFFELDCFDNAGFPIKVPYEIQPHTYSCKYTVWQVVFHTKTNQYIPLKQQSWKLEWDSSQAGPFTVVVIDSPAAPSGRPTDNGTSTDNSSRIKLGTDTQTQLK